MAKTLKQILDGVKSSKIKDKDILGSKPGVDYRPKSGDEQKFADKHKIEQHADRVGNEDDIYQANNINYTMDKKGHGYKSGEDEKVYEEAKCNMTEAGSMCEAHGMKKCPPVLKEKPVKEEAIDEISRGLASRYLNKTNPDYSSPAEVQKRKAGRELALKKKWGDNNFGTAEPKVKATEEVEQVNEKKKTKDILVTMKGNKSAGSVMRIKKSDYDPKKHDLAENQEQVVERKMSDAEMNKREEIVKGMKKKLSDFRARYGKRAKDVMYATATKQAMKEDIKESVLPANSPIRDYKRKDVSGLYNFSHLEHPNGNYIQHNQNKYVHYNKKTGEHESFSRTKSGLADLINHVNKVHSVKEDLAQPLIGATSTPPRENSDGEAAMVKTELRAIANKAMHLVTQMPQGMDIEPWVQSKIAQAKQMVSSVHDYMIYGNHDEKEQTDTPITFPNTNVDTGRI